MHFLSTNLCLKRPPSTCLTSRDAVEWSDIYDQPTKFFEVKFFYWILQKTLKLTSNASHPWSSEITAWTTGLKILANCNKTNGKIQIKNIRGRYLQSKTSNFPVFVLWHNRQIGKTRKRVFQYPLMPHSWVTLPESYFFWKKSMKNYSFVIKISKNRKIPDRLIQRSQFQFQTFDFLFVDGSLGL